jgi:hypothetical protein
MKKLTNHTHDILFIAVYGLVIIGMSIYIVYNWLSEFNMWYFLR